MHRVKYFQKWSMTEIESEINDFIRYHEHTVKIINIAITVKENLLYEALVAYEIN